MASPRPDERRTRLLVRGRSLAVAALLGASASAVSCSLLLDFSGRPDAGAGGGASGGASPSAQQSSSASGGEATSSVKSSASSSSSGIPASPVAAYPLSTCAQSITSPFDKQACDYVDQSCSGFADMSEHYEVGAPPIPPKSTLACDRQALAAYAWSNGAAKEIRVIARERVDGSSCGAPPADVDGGVSGEKLVLLRIEAPSLATIAETEIQISTNGALVSDSVPMAIGRTERRLLFAYRAFDPIEMKDKIVVATAPVDSGPAAQTSPPPVWELNVAASLDASSSFDPVHVSGSDDPILGKVLVAVEDRSGLAPVTTLGNETATETLAYSSQLDFNGNVRAPSTGERVFPRTKDVVDAGITGEREGPAAICTADVPDVTVMSDDLAETELGALRYLVSDGVGHTISTSRPWYSAAALVPSNPGPSFGEDPNYTRLDVFTLDGKSYAQLRSCSDVDHGACAIGASFDGGPGDLSGVTIGDCDTNVRFVGAAPGEAAPDGGDDPTFDAICLLDPTPLVSGLVTWDRVAGAMGAAIEQGGGRIWFLRPGDARVAGTNDVRLSLATSIDTDTTPLADVGPVDATFVPGAGWVVSAVTTDGKLWQRMFGCP